MSAENSNENPASALELDVSERERNILRMLVDHYISEGQPVGSRTISKLPGVGISAASVRNVMGDLESMGLLKSPHTSAGRVPTSAAYRIFVDSMLEYRELERGVIAEIKSALDPSLSDQALIKVASNYLSGMTEMAGMITVPKQEQVAVKQIEFLPMSEHRVLAILILSNDEVDNRVVRMDRDYSKEELEEFARFLNQEYLGRPLSEVRSELQNELHMVRDDMSQRMKLMIELAGKGPVDGAKGDKEDLLVAGETNLMAHEDLSDVAMLRDLFEAFQQKRDIYHLMEQCISAEGVQIFIGKEAGFDVLQDCSLITSPYEVDGSIVGVMGVIGPKRMAYDKVIPVVDITSKLLSAALNSKK